MFLVLHGLLIIFFIKLSKRGGRFADGRGSCEKTEKRFNKPNYEVPKTAESRAKNNACRVSTINTISSALLL
jgi:hypothetical protein